MSCVRKKEKILADISDFLNHQILVSVSAFRSYTGWVIKGFALHTRTRSEKGKKKTETHNNDHKYINY